jgi:hypothetical protein
MKRPDPIPHFPVNRRRNRRRNRRVPRGVSFRQQPRRAKCVAAAEDGDGILAFAE